MWRYIPDVSVAVCHVLAEAQDDVPVHVDERTHRPQRTNRDVSEAFLRDQRHDVGCDLPPKAQGENPVRVVQGGRGGKRDQEREDDPEIAVEDAHTREASPRNAISALRRSFSRKSSARGDACVA